MAKIVKIKQKDIENIVKNIVKESAEDLKKMDTDTNLSEADFDSSQIESKYEIIEPEPRKGFYLARDKDGNVYAIDGETGQILDKT